MDKTVIKKKTQVREQIFYNFVQILDSFPQYTISQHMSHVLREKGNSQDHYFWNDEELLKRFEQYYDELNSELVVTTEEI